MLHARRRIAGGIDHQLDRFLAEQGLDIVGNPGAARPDRRGEIPRRMALRRPADTRQIFAGGPGVQIGDGGDVNARRADRLGKEHRGELAAAENADPDRVVLRLAFPEESVKVHAARSADPGIGAVRQSSGNASMGAKSRWAIHSGRLKRRMWFSTWQSDR